MDVHFCSNCNNMTYIHSDDKDNLYHVCKVCSNKEAFIQDGSIFNMNNEDVDISEIINTNKHIVHDIALPVIEDNNNIKCTNNECMSIREKLGCKITYIKYNLENMKYLYICNYCGQKWKNSSS